MQAPTCAENRDKYLLPTCRRRKEGWETLDNKNGQRERLIYCDRSLVHCEKDVIFEMSMLRLFISRHVSGRYRDSIYKPNTKQVKDVVGSNLERMPVSEGRPSSSGTIGPNQTKRLTPPLEKSEKHSTVKLRECAWSWQTAISSPANYTINDKIDKILSRPFVKDS